MQAYLSGRSQALTTPVEARLRPAHEPEHHDKLSFQAPAQGGDGSLAQLESDCSLKGMSILRAFCFLKFQEQQSHKDSFLLLVNFGLIRLSSIFPGWALQNRTAFTTF